MIVVIDMSVASMHLSTLPRVNFHHAKRQKEKDCDNAQLLRENEIMRKKNKI